MCTKAAQCECKVDVMNTQRQVEEDRENLYEHVHRGGKKGLRNKQTRDGTVAIKLIQFGSPAHAQKKIRYKLTPQHVCCIPHE